MPPAGAVTDGHDGGRLVRGSPVAAELPGPECYPGNLEVAAFESCLINFLATSTMREGLGSC